MEITAFSLVLSMKLKKRNGCEFDSGELSFYKEISSMKDRKV